MYRRTPSSTRNAPPFPYPTRCRSVAGGLRGGLSAHERQPWFRGGCLVCAGSGLVPVVRSAEEEVRMCSERCRLRGSTVSWRGDIVPPPEAKSPPSQRPTRSEEHTSELQSLMRSSYAVFCLKKTNQQPSNYEASMQQSYVI